MIENTSFGIDFSEAKPILDLPYTDTQTQRPPTPPPPLEIWGFAAPSAHPGRASGPCALGTLLHFNQIGWSHLPKEKNGIPVNNPFIEEVMRWSETPNLPQGNMDTSPNQMLKSLRKAGMIATWYAGNGAEKTLELIHHELSQSRPVLVLVNHGTATGQPLQLEWQVVFKIDSRTLHTKHGKYNNAESSWSIEQFRNSLEMDLPALSCSIITAEKG